MATNNSLTKPDFNTKVIEYESNGQMVKLSPSIIRQYLVNGNGAITDQEVAMFLNLCRYQHLNPFLREVFLIKYGDKNPATMVTGKETFEKRAFRNKSFAGKQAGVIVQKEDGTLENRIGAIVLGGEELIGGWAKIFVKGYEHPVETAVMFDEYAGKKSDGELNSQWKTKPATMIRKCALVSALREAFPEDFGGLYSQEEINTGDVVLNESPIPVEAIPAEEAPQPAADPLSD